MKKKYTITMLALIAGGLLIGIWRIDTYLENERKGKKAALATNLDLSISDKEVVEKLKTDPQALGIVAKESPFTDISEQKGEPLVAAVKSSETPIVEKTYYRETPQDELIPFSQLEQSRRYFNYQSVRIRKVKGVESPEEVKRALELISLHH